MTCDYFLQALSSVDIGSLICNVGAGGGAPAGGPAAAGAPAAAGGDAPGNWIEGFNIRMTCLTVIVAGYT